MLSTCSSPVVRNRRTQRSAALLLLGATALAGCGVTRDGPSAADASASPPSSSPASPSATVTMTVTASPSATPSTPPPTTPTPTANGPEGALLSAAELPPVNDTSTWTQTRTGPAGTDAFGLCQKVDLDSIGATGTVERDFSVGSDTAGQQVAEFADAQTAVRAGKVVAAWHATCRPRVPGRDKRVRPISSVPVTQGSGSWYLVSYVRGGEGHFEAFGMALSGTRMTLLKMDQAGQDRNYEPGQDPMELAVQRASAKLGG